MKNILLICVLLLNTSLSLAAIGPGNPIKATDIRSSSFAIGSVQQSILSLAQFRAENGDCWRLMDGSPLSGTDLGMVTQMTSLPDATSQGTFLRQAKSGRVLGSYEADDNKAHSHTLTKSGGGLSDGIGAHPGTSPIGSYTTATVGGAEARPKNIALNFFIKVNRDCNFE